LFNAGNQNRSIEDGESIVVKFMAKKLTDATKPQWQQQLPSTENKRGRCADYSTANRILGWELRISLRDGLEDTYRWIEENMDRP